MKKRLRVTITGNVQGVFFRHSTKQKAKALAVCGFVRNEPNGNVYIEAEGEEETLQEFIAWCRKGPEMAGVKDVTIVETPPAGFTDFTIKD